MGDEGSGPLPGFEGVEKNLEVDFVPGGECGSPFTVSLTRRQRTKDAHNTHFVAMCAALKASAQGCANASLHSFMFVNHRLYSSTPPKR